MVLEGLYLFGLAYAQNVAFSMTSRSRNRDNMYYHAICSCFGNAIFFLTFRELVLSDLALWMLPVYVVGNVSGSICGAKVSMRIEKMFDIKC
jgi:hypothetical protein